MNEFTWDVELDGVEHHLLAVKDKQGSGYHLYDGDDYITNILPAKTFGMQIGVEQEFEVDGHKMRFCQWEINTPPDIEQNGHMVLANISYAEAKDKVLRSNFATYVAILVFMLLYLPVATLITGDSPDISQYIAVLLFVVYYVYKTVKIIKNKLDLKRMKEMETK